MVQPKGQSKAQDRDLSKAQDRDPRKCQQALSLEHKLLKSLRPLKPPQGIWLLAVSGGVDSMVMTEILWRWRRLLKIELSVAYVHHGVDQNVEFRAQAQSTVREWCRNRRVKFVTNKVSPVGLRSEAQLREYRQRCLRRWHRELKCAVIAFAHHSDDLLETRILRLIRGVGGGGMRAMSVYQGQVWRPLLGLTRQEIEDYAASRSLGFEEDPTNQDTSAAFRNWVRHEWLPRLELRQRGATKSLARSLENLAPVPGRSFSLADYVGLRRELLGSLGGRERFALVAEYLRTVGLQSYGRTHIDEILKRLNSRQKKFSFEILGCLFQVTPDLVWASRV